MGLVSAEEGEQGLGASFPDFPSLEPWELPPCPTFTDEDYRTLRERYAMPAKASQKGQPASRGRRPPRLDSPAVQHLLAALKAGAYVQTAAQAAGLGERTVYRWLERGQAEEQEGTQGDYWQLWQAIETARFIAQSKALGAIQAAAERGQWRAAAWWLERAHPRQWGRQSQGMDSLDRDMQQGPPVTVESLDRKIRGLLAALPPDAPDAQAS